MPSSYNLKDAVPRSYAVKIAVHENDSGQSLKEEAEPDAGGTNKDDKSDKGEKNLEGATVRSTDVD